MPPYPCWEFSTRVGCSKMEFIYLFLWWIRIWELTGRQRGRAFFVCLFPTSGSPFWSCCENVKSCCKDSVLLQKCLSEVPKLPWKKPLNCSSLKKSLLFHLSKRLMRPVKRAVTPDFSPSFSNFRVMQECEPLHKHML